ncbi:MAG: cytochrome ubiquinol oxidase subunit I [Acidobacteria bacterium]|nr:cytochrome ubiquinol oxidase subunit I [Acidobacteriota bacterium]MCG3195459.1 hypothetical protein [Thermoanaerobaculia bacterium]MCK6682597.1 cytochrome ubiquinol oxidase subunit I [Thermoanaerobaculia bacterium]
MDYPLFTPAIGGGILIAVISILHVVVSHFAVGGGIVLFALESLSIKNGRDPVFRNAARRGSRILILVSTVFGAISGVGIWFTIGVVQPAGTADLIRLFVWVWAIEWAFFLLEIVTALLYYSTWEKVSPRTHLLLIGLYAFSAYMSLVIIQGILSFMSTPGAWPRTGDVADAFFNPTYLPGLVLRSGVCLLLAGAYLMLAVLAEKDPAGRARLVRFLAAFESMGAALAAAGYFWWENALEPAMRLVFLGPKPLLPGLSATRNQMMMAGLLCLALALLALLAPRFQAWPAAVVSLLAGFAVLGGYERVREGSRKPYVVRPHVFSNGLHAREIDSINQRGILEKSRFARLETGRASPSATEAAATGRAVFRSQCAACHTIDGYLGIRKLTKGADTETLNMILTLMKGDGEGRKKLLKGEEAPLDYPLMPPFVGTDSEQDALAQYLVSLQEVRDAR